MIKNSSNEASSNISSLCPLLTLTGRLLYLYLLTEKVSKAKQYYRSMTFKYKYICVYCV